jgi:AmmeMemoRadiSam system protein B
VQRAISFATRSVALAAVGFALARLTTLSSPEGVEEVLMRYPFYHRETLRTFERLNREAANRPENPRLRRVDVFPFRGNGAVYYALTDPTRVSQSAVTLTAAGLRVAELLDGTRSLDEVERQAATRFPGADTAQQVRSLVHSLGEQLLLFDTAYRAAVIRQVQTFLSSAERAPINAGSSYPEDGEAARTQLLAYLDSAEIAAPNGTPRGLIAPHIDYQRGHATYARAFSALRGIEGVSRFVILGTSHNPGVHRFAATRKNYRTSLGTAVTDADFLDRLAARYPHPLFEDEFLHRGEHSIELEIPFLQVLFGPEVRIVPILCGSLHDLIAQRTDPMSDPEVSAFVRALRQTMDQSAGESFVIAAADLSHMGPHFGDEFVMDHRELSELERRDRTLLDRIAADDPRGFIATLSATNNATRVCGAAPIYTLLQVLGPAARVQVLDYRQCTDDDRFTTVTIPAATIAF